MTANYLKITLVVIGYWTISISMVFANKYLLGNRDSGKDVSFFIAWIQCITTSALIAGYSVLSKVTKGDWQYLKFGSRSPLTRHVLTMSCTFVGMLSFNNLCLKHVGVSFYQVARSLTLIFVVIFSVVLLKKSISYKIALCCLAVAGGFVLGVDQESLAGTMSTSGVMFGMITSLFVALNGIFTKTALEVVDRSEVRLTFYNNLNAIVLFLPFVIATGQLQTVLDSPEMHTSFFLICLFGTGCLGFMISWISAVQINVTSPVTHHISANAKAVLQTLIAVMYNGESKTFLWWLSILMVVSGAFAYTFTKIKEEKQLQEEAITDANKNLVEKTLDQMEAGKLELKTQEGLQD